MISDEINHLIETAKLHKSGESRNSMISRLKDARAHAFVMEREEFIYDPMKRSDSVMVQELSKDCICPAPGVRDKNCRAAVHK